MPRITGFLVPATSPLPMTFDSVAPFYDLLARLAFGRSLIRAQQWGIDQVRVGSRVLLLGGGTGVTLPDLMTRQPAHISYVEASAGMLARARQRPRPGAPITFVLGTETALAETELFDYILLPFVLDVYDVRTLRKEMVPTLLSHLSPDGQLIVTDFDQPRAHWQRAYMWLMLRFFRLTAGIPVHEWSNWPPVLEAAGLTERKGQLFRSGQVRSGCWVRG